MVIAEKIKDVRRQLETTGPSLHKKALLALPSSTLVVEEVTDPDSQEFKKAMQIYVKTFPKDEREEVYKIANYLKSTQKTGKAHPGSNSEFHVLVVRDTTIAGNKTDQIVAASQMSYFPGDRFGVRWYTSVDPRSRGSLLRIVEGVDNFMPQLQQYAAKHGEKPIGFFNDVEVSKKSMGDIVERTGYFVKDVEFEIPPVRKGGHAHATRLGFMPYQSVDLPGWALRRIVGEYMKSGFGIKQKDLERNPQYLKAVKNINDDNLYRFAKKR
ncbi:MAG: hypothetical protein HYT71_02705 [Candidatus Aenigmarchaeota archaeon]|nr:hypothetical protein [Candidatus Aenigmarchaeota archaeon]